jgi:threonine synthase
MKPWHFRCEQCAHEIPIDTRPWRCESGEMFSLVGPERFSAEDIDRRSSTFERYRALLPLGDAPMVTLGGGMTPLVPGTIAGRAVWFKLDSQLPTGSFKDRGAAVVVAHLQRLGINRVVVDSSGNAAAAMAGYSAAAGIDCTVYAPATASPGKLVQARAYGSTVVPVEGDRDAVAAAAQAAAEGDSGTFYSSHNWSPIFSEGVKTWALEVWEQLGDRPPSTVFVPTGGGSALAGAWRGFTAFGSWPPRIVAVQPAACAPIVEAFRSGAARAIPTTPGSTLAEGAKIGSPARDALVLQALRNSKGWAEAVSEDALVAALRDLWGQGVYAEPTAALGAAACRAAIERGELDNDGEVVILITGSGLKATETIEALLES